MTYSPHNKLRKSEAADQDGVDTRSRLIDTLIDYRMRLEVYRNPVNYYIVVSGPLWINSAVITGDALFEAWIIVVSSFLRVL